MTAERARRQVVAGVVLAALGVLGNVFGVPYGYTVTLLFGSIFPIVAVHLLGAGAGIAFNPVLLAAMGDVEPHESGLASGVVNTSFMMGGALGLAVLVSLSTARTESLAAAGAGPLEALNGGFQLAFAAGAVGAALAALVGGALLRPQPMVVPELDPDAEACSEPA